MFKVSKNEKGEAYVGEAVKIVVAIVLGAAILAGLVLVANKVILPKTSAYIESLFGEAGRSSENIAIDLMGVTKEATRAEVLDAVSPLWAKCDESEWSTVSDIVSVVVYGREETYNGMNKEQLLAMCETNANDSALSASERQMYQGILDYKADYDTPSYQSRLNKFEAEYVNAANRYNNGETTLEQAKVRINEAAQTYGFEVDWNYMGF